MGENQYKKNSQV